MATRKHYNVTGYIDSRDDGKFDAALGHENENIFATSKGFASYSAAETWLTNQIVGQVQDHLRNNRKITSG